MRENIETKSKPLVSCHMDDIRSVDSDHRLFPKIT